MKRAHMAHGSMSAACSRKSEGMSTSAAAPSESDTAVWRSRYTRQQMSSSTTDMSAMIDSSSSRDSTSCASAAHSASPTKMTGTAESTAAMSSETKCLSRMQKTRTKTSATPSGSRTTGLPLKAVQKTFFVTSARGAEAEGE